MGYHNSIFKIRASVFWILIVRYRVLGQLCWKLSCITYQIVRIYSILGFWLFDSLIDILLTGYGYDITILKMAIVDQTNYIEPIDVIWKEPDTNKVGKIKYSLVRIQHIFLLRAVWFTLVSPFCLVSVLTLSGHSTVYKKVWKDSGFSQLINGNPQRTIFCQYDYKLIEFFAPMFHRQNYQSFG